MLEVLFFTPGAAVVLFTRWRVARALGMRGITFWGGAIEDPAAATAGRRAIVVLAGLATSYLLAGVLFAAALLLGGKSVATTEVIVTPGSPAALAGMETGDRVTSLAGDPVADWEALTRAIRRHPGEPIAAIVVRGGGERSFTVTPEVSVDGKAKIGVASVMKREPAGVGAALGAAITAPALVLVQAGRGWAASLLGRAEVEMAGAATIVRETAGAAKRGPGDALELLAALLAYVWPISAILALALVPRRPRAKAVREKR